MPHSGLPSDLRRLKQQLNIMLVSFQDVALTLPPFRQFYYFETFAFLLDTMTKFYAGNVFFDKD